MSLRKGLRHQGLPLPPPHQMNDMLTRGGRLRHEDYVLNNKDEETDSHQLYKVGEGGGGEGALFLACSHR